MQNQPHIPRAKRTQRFFGRGSGGRPFSQEGRPPAPLILPRSPYPSSRLPRPPSFRIHHSALLPPIPLLRSIVLILSIMSIGLHSSSLAPIPRAFADHLPPIFSPVKNNCFPCFLRTVYRAYPAYISFLALFHPRSAPYTQFLILLPTIGNPPWGGNARPYISGRC